MKILISKDNYSFWVDVCEQALKLNGGKYNISSTSEFKEYIQLFNKALESNTAVCVDIDTLRYMLDCGDSNMAYIYHYNREKDKRVYEI